MSPQDAQQSPLSASLLPIPCHVASKPSCCACSPTALPFPHAPLHLSTFSGCSFASCVTETLGAQDGTWSFPVPRGTNLPAPAVPGGEACLPSPQQAWSCVLRPSLWHPPSCLPPSLAFRQHLEPAQAVPSTPLPLTVFSLGRLVQGVRRPFCISSPAWPPHPRTPVFRSAPFCTPQSFGLFISP